MRTLVPAWTATIVLCLNASASEPPTDPAGIWSRIIGDRRTGLHESDGWTFSVSMFRPISDSVEAQELAFEKARFDAMVALARDCVDLEAFSGSLQEGPATMLQEQALVVLQRRISLAGVQQVDGGITSEGTAMVVMAIPSEVLDRQVISVDDVVSSLGSRGEEGSLEWPQAMLWCEIADEATRARAAGKLAEVLSSQFGPGVGETLRGVRPACMSAGWKALPRALDAASLEKLNVEQLLAALGRRPHDPEIVAAIARRCGARGWVSCSRAFEESPALVRWRPLDAPTADPEVSLDTPLCKLILATSGAVPFAGQTSSEAGSVPTKVIDVFNAGRAAESAQLLIAESPDCPDPQWLSFLSASLYQVGMMPESRVFAELAFRMDPRHPYAGVNLLRALCRLEDWGEVRDMLEEVRSRSELNDWGRAQLAIVEESLAKAAIPPAEGDVSSAPSH